VSGAKEHLADGAFGKSACGMRNVATTHVLGLVTCLRCRRTRLFLEKP
jgi:hypothetical protein